MELPKILRQEVQMIAPKSNPEQDQVEKDKATVPLTSPSVETPVTTPDDVHDAVETPMLDTRKPLSGVDDAIDESSGLF